MRIEIFIFIIIVLFLYNSYHNNKFGKLFIKYTKYYKQAMIIFSIFCFYLLFKKNPNKGQNLLLYANNMIKMMPIDKASMNLINPILDFTTGKCFMEKFNQNFTEPQNINSNQPIAPHLSNSQPKATKRSVSETKKKFVASQQGWKCQECKEQLNAWFEVDHKIRLEYGGGNNVENLVALCRECHGRKTAMENM